MEEIVMYGIRCSGPNRRITPALVLALFAAILSHGAARAVTLLDFEDLAAFSTVNAQYAPRGVIFHDAYIDIDAAAHSGHQIIRSVNPSQEIFTPAPFVIDFTSAQNHIRFFGGSSFASLNGTLR